MSAHHSLFPLSLLFLLLSLVIDDGPVSIVEMLFCTSLVALVGTPDSNSNASPRRLQIVNTKVSRQSLTFRDPLRLNRGDAKEYGVW